MMSLVIEQCDILYQSTDEVKAPVVIWLGCWRINDPSQLRRPEL